MENLPLLSVIVPVYGVEKYLNQCIQSIVDQTYRNLEIILVDDGSPDRCGKICDEWAQKDSRIRVIHQKNAGAGAARNTALDVARGELIGIIDSDDYISPNMYQHLYGLLGEDVDLAECRIGITCEDQYPFSVGKEGETKLVSAQEAMALHIQDEIFRQTPPNKLYRRQAIGDIRFPVGNLIDDEFFTYRVIGNCRRLAHSTACMYAYRQQEGSAMHKAFSIKRLELLKAKQERLCYIREKMPELESLAKINLIEACLYCMQNSLRYLAAEELQQAESLIYRIMESARITGREETGSYKKYVLIQLAQWNLKATSILLNWLIDLKILT